MSRSRPTGRSLRRLLLPLAAAWPCLLAATGAAQVPAGAPRVKGSVEVSLVNVDVVVTGKDGRPVEGLSASDFTVLHGKKPAAITNFREERAAPRPTVASAPAPAPAPAPEETAAALPEPPPARRHVVLFVDHLALPDAREREQVFGALKSLVRRTVRPGDGVMVVTWRFGVRSAWPFTDDVALVERQLDAAALGTIRLGLQAQNELDQFAATEAFSVWAGVPPDTSLSRNLSVEQAYNEFKGKASAILGLISTMAGMEGKKVLVIASRSLSRRPGAELAGTRVDTGPLLDEIAARANAAGVTIHSLYAAAWQSEMPNVTDSRFSNPRIAGSASVVRADDKRLDELTGLDKLTGRTGGVLVATTMESPLFADRVASDLVHWYSLGYPVPAGADVAARVSVRVNRPGAKVRARRDVGDRTPVQRIEDRVLANLFRADEGSRLPITLTAGSPVEEGRKRFVTTAHVRVPVRHLVLLPGADGHRGAVSVFWVAADPGGEFSDVKRERHDVVLPADAAGPESKVELNLELRLEAADPGARISIAAWDETGGEAGFGLIRPAAR